MASVGKIGEYNSEIEDWAQYTERMTFYFAANDITTAEKQKATFLAVIGPKTYTLARTLIAPERIADKSLKDLTDVLEEHFSPKPSAIVQRSKFYNRTRKSEETVAAFLAELRKIAEFCDFGNKLDDMLRDRLVCGINDTSIQRKLLSEGDKLTLKDALKLASSMEVAYRDSHNLPVPPPSTDPIHRVNRQQASGHRRYAAPHTPPTAGQSVGKSGITNPCYRCLGTNHKAMNCPHKSARCFNCSKVGHINRACRAPSKTPNTSTSSSRQSHRATTSKSIRTLTEEEADSIEYESESLAMNNVHSSSKPIFIDVTINDIPVTMELDTGAAVSIISKAAYSKHWPNKPLERCQTRLNTYSGERINVCGSMNVDVRCEGQSHKVPLIVVDSKGPNLFGRDWLRVFKLNWKCISNVMQESSLQEVLGKYGQVFEEGLRTLVNFKAKIYVDPKAIPKFYKARPLPYVYRAKVEEKLDCLVEQGVLEPIQHAEWAAPIVAVLKKDEQKNIRVCGDFKCTVNAASKLDRYPIPKIEDLFAKLAGGKYFSKLDMSQAYQQVPLDEESKQYVVINTHKGLFRYNRLPFGIASAPGIF